LLQFLKTMTTKINLTSENIMMWWMKAEIVKGVKAVVARQRAVNTCLRQQYWRNNSGRVAFYAMWSVQMLYNMSFKWVSPASRRRRRKGKSQIWDSKIRSQVPRDYGRERLPWQGPAAHTKDRPVLSSERASHWIKNVTVRRILYSERKKNLVVSLGWVLYTKTDWPTGRRS
jgi:hypothetical protein